MGVLNGLRVAGIKLYESRKNINSNGGIVYSEDNELIEKKLDEILDKVINNGADDKEILRDALYELVNRIGLIYNFDTKKGSIYLLDNKKCNWKYKLVIDGDNGVHSFELHFDDRTNKGITSKKVIEAISSSTLKGDILDFTIKYHTDISAYLSHESGKGTRMIEIRRLEDGSVSYEDRIYSLDLLNNSYSDELIKGSCISDVRAPLLARRY